MYKNVIKEEEEEEEQLSISNVYTYNTKALTRAPANSISRFMFKMKAR